MSQKICKVSTIHSASEFLASEHKLLLITAILTMEWMVYITLFHSTDQMVHFYLLHLLLRFILTIWIIASFISIMCTIFILLYCYPLKWIWVSKLHKICDPFLVKLLIIHLSASLVVKHSCIITYPKTAWS